MNKGTINVNLVENILNEKMPCYYILSDLNPEFPTQTKELKKLLARTKYATLF